MLVKKLFVLIMLVAISAMMIVPVHACYFTPGYWKKKPWPVTEVTLCGVTLTEQEGRALLKTPIKGDLTVQLAHQLIAAKLNCLAAGYLMSAYDGTGPAGGNLIEEAEDFLWSVGGVPPNPPLSTEDHETCSDYIELLDKANNTPW